MSKELKTFKIYLNLVKYHWLRLRSDTSLEKQECYQKCSNDIKSQKIAFSEQGAMGFFRRKNDSKDFLI